MVAKLYVCAADKIVAILSSNACSICFGRNVFAKRKTRDEEKQGIFSGIDIIWFALSVHLHGKQRLSNALIHLLPKANSGLCM